MFRNVTEAKTDSMILVRWKAKMPMDLFTVAQTYLTYTS